MISARYAGFVAALVAIALIPTTIHTYLGTVVADGLTVAAIPDVLDSMPSRPTERRPAWVRNNLDSTDWLERVYTVGGKEVTLFASRSYDAKRLYHHPELAVLRGTETTPAGVIRLETRPNLPVHLLKTEKDGRRGLAMYVLEYDGRFIENPVAFQLRTAAELLVTGRKAMTLILASDLAGEPKNPDQAPAAALLLAAVSRFEAQAPASK